MLIQTKKFGNMLINLANQSTGNTLISNQVYETDESEGINIPIGSLETELPQNLSVIMHFDAKTILPSDIDPITLNVLRATNLSSQSQFTIWGQSTSQHMNGGTYTARIQNGGLTSRYGYLNYELPQALQIIYPINFFYTTFSVFSLNTDPLIWLNMNDAKNGTLINTCAHLNGGYSWVLSLRSQQKNKQFLVIANRRRHYFNLPAIPSIHNDILTKRDGQKYILKMEYKYTDSINEHSVSLLLKTITGGEIINETSILIGPWIPDWRKDKWITIGGYEDFRNHSKLNIHEVLFSTKQFNTNEHNVTMNYLKDRWI